MPAIHGYRVAVRKSRPKRPAGVGILAAIGVFGSLATLLIALVQLLSLLRAGVEPSRQLAAVAVALVLSFIVLWINWGFWELIRWAWWANLLLTVVNLCGLFAATRAVPAIAGVAGRIWRGADARQLTTYVLIGLIVLIAYHVIAVFYIIAVRALYTIGVKEERPLWEQAQRRSR